MRNKLLMGILMAIALLATGVIAIGTITPNLPSSGQELNSSTFTFKVTVTQAGSENITNATFVVSGTRYDNGTRNGTDLVFTKPIDISALSNSVSYYVEVRNQTGTDILDSSKNSSTITFIIDRTAPSAKLLLSTTRIRPFGEIELDCSKSTDSYTKNTSKYNMYITDSQGLRTTSSDTSGIVAFNGATTSVKGEFTAGCNATDNAGNLGASVEETFFVTEDSAVPAKEEKQQQQQQAAATNTSWMMYMWVLIFLAVIAITVVSIQVAKKAKKKR